MKDIHHKKQLIACTKCDTNYATKLNLFVHDKRKHPKVQQRVIKPKKTCNICKFTCCSMQTLEKHTMKHTVYIHCSLCNKRIKDIPHVIKRHKDTHSKVRQQCDICLKVFENKIVLGGHLKTHGLQMRVECAKCLKSVVNLPGHRRYCEDIRNLPCKLCPKMFGIKSEMIRHVRVSHLKERNFKCKICPKSYTDPTPLKHHVNVTHGDGSTFSHCSHCKKYFTTKRRFNEHNIKYHEGTMNI